MSKSISPLLPIVYSSEVVAAKARGAPIVALESTIITHGMPYPGNLDMARSVEQIIRNHGAVPATIAVIEGVLHIGLEDGQIAALAQMSDVMKLSRADLAFALAERRTGATSIAARRRASTFPPTWRNWPAPRSSSSRRDRRPFSTFRRHWKCWKPAACPW